MNEKFAINVMQVSKIIDFQDYTKIPFSADYMEGLLNLSGKVIPLLNTRCLLGYNNCEFNKEFKIIIVDSKVNDKKLYAGLLVDSVANVTDIKQKDIQNTTNIGKNIKSRFITGIANLNSEFVMLVNMTKIFEGREWELITTQSELEQVKLD